MTVWPWPASCRRPACPTVRSDSVTGVSGSVTGRARDSGLIKHNTVVTIVSGSVFVGFSVMLDIVNVVVEFLLDIASLLSCD